MIEPLAIWPFINKSNSGSILNIKKNILVLDTTLRDGEQTEGVSFSAEEKLILAKKLLIDVEVNRLEIASAKVSIAEENSCKNIFSWAKEHDLLDKVEVLGFVDFNKSVDWISGCGGKVINLLCKGSEKHLLQLKKNPEEHFDDISKTVSYAKSKGFVVNAYLEDFSNGALNSMDYVVSLIEVLNNNGVSRVMLADTLGVLSPDKTKDVVSFVVEKFPSINFDFHAHNDYGLALANSLAAVSCGVSCVHCTVNGLGERAGNTPLEEFVPAVKDFFGVGVSVNEDSLSSVSKLVELFSRYRVARNKPIVGSVVFTQTAGIHADGDKKGSLYCSNLSPNRFGRKTRYALGKLSGKASVEMALRDLGISLNDDLLKKVLEKVVELGEKKENVTKEDLLFLIDEVTNNNHSKVFSVDYYNIVSSSSEKPFSGVVFSFYGKKFTVSGIGDGGYDAFMSSLKKWALEQKIVLPELVDYEVRIPSGGKTDALVETKITWDFSGKLVETIALSTDQLEAAIRATEKMINLLFIIRKDEINKSLNKKRSKKKVAK